MALSVSATDARSVGVSRALGGSAARVTISRARGVLFAASLVVGLASGAVAIGGCDGGGGGGGGSSGSDGVANSDDSCSLQTSLSGGVNATFGDTSLACAYTSRTVVFTTLEAKPVVTIVLRDIGPGQTGSFPAAMEVTSNKERWTGATCSVNVESNAKVQSASDSGVSFDQYLLKGSGACSTPAVFRSDAGMKEPVTIAPFRFTARILFY